MFYFNTNVLHYTYDQMAWMMVIDALGDLAGVIVFRIFFSKTSFKKMIMITTCCFSLAQASKLMLTQQLTHKIGLEPIVYTYLTEWIYNFVNELHLMPLMVLACKMCPKQVEASFYALVLVVINLGYTFSYQLGGIFTYNLGITSTNFDHLWILVVIASACPLLTLLILLIIPSKFDVNAELEKYFKKQSENNKKTSS